MTASTARPPPLSPRPTSRSPGRRRTRERLVRAFFLAAAALSIVISGAIVFSLLGNALYFLINVDTSALLADGWFPRRGMYDIATIVAGTLVISGVGDAGRHAARTGSRDLPLRVRQPARATAPQADPRDPGLDPERRPRLLRPDLDQPEPRPAAHRRPALEHGRRRAGGRHPHHAARGVDQRGRHARRARATCARPRTGSAPGSARRACGSSSPPRSPASWPRCCWGSRAPSARR